MMEVLSSGALNLIQDLGRNGYMSQGISRGGAMDTLALSLANVLVGNHPDTAAIEINIFPFRVKFEEDVWFACTGGNSAITLDDETVSVWWRKQAKAGQTLVIERPGRACGSISPYAAVSMCRPYWDRRQLTLSVNWEAWPVVRSGVAISLRPTISEAGNALPWVSFRHQSLISGAK
nr:hypothetical protein [Pantoea bituminis]